MDGFGEKNFYQRGSIADLDNDAEIWIWVIQGISMKQLGLLEILRQIGILTNSLVGSQSKHQGELVLK